VAILCIQLHTLLYIIIQQYIQQHPYHGIYVLIHVTEITSNYSFQTRQSITNGLLCISTKNINLTSSLTQWFQWCIQVTSTSHMYTITSTSLQCQQFSASLSAISTPMHSWRLARTYWHQATVLWLPLFSIMCLLVPLRSGSNGNLFGHLSIQLTHCFLDCSF